MILAWIIGFGAMGSVGAILLASVYLLFPEKTRLILVSCLISYATGTLLGAAFLGLLRHALTQAPAAPILSVTLAGILVFFLLEKVVIWRHCHDAGCQKHSTAGPLILIGDALHNFIDGIAIAAAFITSIPLGVGTALAVFAHEFPQEVGDFAILIQSGYSRKRALLFNILSGISTVPGALMAYFFLRELRELTPYVMAISAASFIYIAIADLIPGLHQRASMKETISQIILILVGVGTIVLFHAQG
jgi:zinc and cadmium transporter